MQNTRFTKGQFIDFIISQLKATIKDGESIVTNDDFSLSITGGRVKQTIYLSNLWTEYSRNGDLNQIVDFLQKDIVAQEKVKNAKDNFDLVTNKHLILPSIRSTEMLKGLENTNGTSVSIVSSHLFENLEKIYFLWQEGFQIPINSTMFQTKGNITEEEIRLVAEENLLRQGWTPPSESGQLRAGKFLIFNEGRKLINYQFFIREWVEEHIGNEFYISFPNKNITLVFIPDKKAKQKQFLFDRQFIKDNTLMDYNRAYPICNLLFSYRNGDFTKIM